MLNNEISKQIDAELSLSWLPYVDAIIAIIIHAVSYNKTIVFVQYHYKNTIPNLILINSLLYPDWLWLDRQQAQVRKRSGELNLRFHWALNIQREDWAAVQRGEIRDSATTPRHNC